MTKRPANLTVYLVGLVCLVSYSIYLLYSLDGYDPADFVLGRDFANMHLGGTLVTEGRQDVLFNSQAYYDEIRAVHGEDYAVHNWSYPPSIWPLVQILATMPYYVSYLIWTLLGAAMIYAATRVLGLHPVWVVLLVFSPAGFFNLLAGQNGFLIAGLLGLATAATCKSQFVRAGIFWALMTMKPHMGACVLPMLLGRKEFKTILAGAVALAAILGTTLILYGIEPWQSFLSHTTKQQVFVLETWGGLMFFIVPTIFMQGRLVGAEIQTAYLAHGAFALLAAVALWRAWPKDPTDIRRWMLWLAAGTIAVLPYNFLYDMMILQLALAMWADEPEALVGTEPGLLPKILFATLWLSPILSFLIVGITHMQVLPWILLLLLLQQAKLRD